MLAPVCSTVTIQVVETPPAILPFQPSNGEARPVRGELRTGRHLPAIARNFVETVPSAPPSPPYVYLPLLWRDCGRRGSRYATTAKVYHHYMVLIGPSGRSFLSVLWMARSCDVNSACSLPSVWIQEAEGDPCSCKSELT